MDLHNYEKKKQDALQLIVTREANHGEQQVDDAVNALTTDFDAMDVDEDDQALQARRRESPRFFEEEAEVHEESDSLPSRAVNQGGQLVDDAISALTAEFEDMDVDEYEYDPTQQARRGLKRLFEEEAEVDEDPESDEDVVSAEETESDGDSEDKEEEEHVRDPSRFVKCYGPRLCGYLAQSSQAEKAPKNADNIAYYLTSKKLILDLESLR